jgi:uncharacterized protein YecE (DUF72 family)
VKSWTPVGATHVGGRLAQFRPSRSVFGFRARARVPMLNAFRFDDARLEYFLRCLPAGLRVPVEFRHRSWDDPAVSDLLERRGASYVVMSGAGLLCVLRATAQLVYVGMHGPDPSTSYAGSYTADDLHWWADRIRDWDRQGRDVLTYFNNDGAGHEVRNARQPVTLVVRRDHYDDPPQGGSDGRAATANGLIADHVSSPR